ncbi:VanZ family protein [Jeotgalibacillus sp. ET6]|uniref:VanZ family protein n=1 Tax=Jeotgalibacillus sp. ET6 TaxID=3037260 RepID=UPI0024185D88|nr:VanZ family protein [Jeotgalibacillus sp. ET6]MDG5472655.1 VanZ family protein [Jeotgalibacillus sp. ET6]
MGQITIPAILLGAVIFIVFVWRDGKGKKKIVYHRWLFYSFIWYGAIVMQLTIGGIHIPPIHEAPVRMQLEPFYFIQEWSTYERFDGYPFFNNARLTFFNFLMLMPLGFYLSALFMVKRVWKAMLLLLGTSLLIESLQLLLSFTGFIWMRVFNVDDLIMNTTGGFLVFLVVRSIQKRKAKKLQDSAA